MLTVEGAFSRGRWETWEEVVRSNLTMPGLTDEMTQDHDEWQFTILPTHPTHVGMEKWTLTYFL